MIKNFLRKKLADFFFKRLSLPKIKPIAKRLMNKLKVLHRESSLLGLKNFFWDDLEEMKGDWKEADVAWELIINIALFLNEVKTTMLTMLS